jgi:hypothetical protein
MTRFDPNYFNLIQIEIFNGNESVTLLKLRRPGLPYWSIHHCLEFETLNNLRYPLKIIVNAGFFDLIFNICCADKINNILSSDIREFAILHACVTDQCC